tara:strand:+ start:312 stop:452 length:141 start_codon:yes stop_codon:yes gene_type:complete
MSRVGVRSAEEALEVMEELKSPYVTNGGIYTHFADAENLDDPSFTK